MTPAARRCDPARLPGPVKLSLTPCRACRTSGVPVVNASDPRTGEKFAYCSIDCARKEGWPWLATEQRPARRRDRSPAHG